MLFRGLVCDIASDSEAYQTTVDGLITISEIVASPETSTVIIWDDSPTGDSELFMVKFNIAVLVHPEALVVTWVYVPLVV